MRMHCQSDNTYDKIMSREDYDRLTPLECQAALLEYAVLDDDAEKSWKNKGRLLKEERVLLMVLL